jgi:hypothetical protein
VSEGKQQRHRSAGKRSARTLGRYPHQNVACMPDFWSTDHTTAFSGGLRYSPHTSPAFSQKSGSWLVIQDSTCQGFKSSALQIGQHWEAELGTPWAAMASARASMIQRDELSGGRVLGDLLHHEQHVVVAVDTGAPGAVQVTQAGQAELGIALAPDADLLELRSTASAMSRFDQPSAASMMIRARLAVRASMVPERDHDSSTSRSPLRKFNGVGTY